MKWIGVGAVLVIWMLAPSCYYDVESELYPYSADCDTTAVTFSGAVLPLFDQYCLVCHSTSDAQGGVALETYTEVLTYVNDGSLICSVNWEQGCSRMPKNSSQLLPCDMLSIELWISNGALND